MVATHLRPNRDRLEVVSLPGPSAHAELSAIPSGSMPITVLRHEFNNSHFVKATNLSLLQPMWSKACPHPWGGPKAPVATMTASGGFGMVLLNDHNHLLRPPYPF